MRTLYYGDNLEILRKYVKTESIDLVYLDPPFNSNVNYNVIFKTKSSNRIADSPSQIRAFNDTWKWNTESSITYESIMEIGDQVSDVIEGLMNSIGKNNMMAYILMMTVRLTELHRVLKSSGSLYLHCDPIASHYLKIILDSIFRPENFRNEIIWKSSLGQKGSQHKTKKVGREHDVILCYAKNTKNVKFNPPKKPLSDAELMAKFPHEDEHGRWKDDSMHIFRTPNMGTRPNLCYTWRGIKNQTSAGWRLSKERLEEEYQKGNIVIKKNGKILRKARLNNYAGENLGDLWTDIKPAYGNERLGYPTQKPLALLERIIKMSSDEGDVILDPFCGCGTTIHAAQKLERKWIGVDITHLATSLIEYRINEAFGIRPTVKGIPTSIESAKKLAKDNPFQFEAWAVTRIPKIKPNEKQVADKGIDGRGKIYMGEINGKSRHKDIIVSVKGGENLNPSMIRDLIGTVNSVDSEGFGVFICIAKPTQNMILSATRAGIIKTPLGAEYPKIQIYTIQDYFDDKIPKLPTREDYLQVKEEKYLSATIDSKLI